MIPTPPAFDIHWNDEAETRFFWQRDVMHFPHQCMPMFRSFVKDILDPGFNHGSTLYGLPIRQRSEIFNTYYYSAMYPVDAPGSHEPPSMDTAHNPLLRAVLDLDARWEGDWQPEIRRIVSALEMPDIHTFTLPALIDHLDYAIKQARRAWEIHFELAVPMLLAMNSFNELYQDLFGTDTFGAFRLLQGIDNKSIEADRALWRLSRRAARLTAVAKLLMERAASEIVPLLRMFDDGRAFLADLDAWLHVYGQRAELFDAITHPSWIEDPAPVIKSLKDYITQPERDIDAERAALANDRDQALAEARAKLAGYPEQVRGQFEAMLASAQAASRIQEDHNYWIDQRAMHQLRRVLRETGWRLALAHSIDRTDDVFLLTLDELRTTLRRIQDSPQNLRELIASRQAELMRWAVVKPPALIGTLPPAPPPDNPVTRTIAKFWGTPPPGATSASELRGNAGSPGKVWGTARIVRSLDEAVKLKKGDILVAETTAPPWTPLFGTAAAIVTETGGILSHCAVVAREYGIPAVVGTMTATSALKDGMWIEVDGSNGVVRILQ
jgi:phosphohistidine swiveling domain-containing protein